MTSPLTGTTVKRRSAFWQWLVAIALFTTPIFSYALFMQRNQRRLAGDDTAIWIFLAVIGISWAIAFGLIRRARGREQVHITDASGVSGVIWFAPLLWFFFFIAGIGVMFLCIILFMEDTDVNSRILFYTILTCVFAIGVPLVGMLRRIHAIRIETDGTLSYRTLLRWNPLVISEYQHIENLVTRGRFNIQVITGVRFMNPDAGKGEVKLNFVSAYSRNYGSPVLPHILDQFFKMRCMEAGFSIRETPQDLQWHAERDHQKTR